ncbi:phosphotransferase [Rhodococcus sp. BP-252]|uniref:phosphotransferase enzyme family protein n=1 Tax=unclassified Rhodococcus (in: high G+C Gram-positive bacteria) TaxID=192944 RepID=UPI001C9A660A|nr:MULTISPECIES: phosphotransferase [unclassified Rhodococcus (in: high G+C Gram-positive bacteria)]MBY6414648.1 phosphotransferase [Rhodococcus sp. BP-320]MBY6419473.1 phosphotransferase [Rhodococcus sp. BP-321]MBY6424515.1 phosphotransferase [Rhodococcus sp. BP-324]MBY6429484.1 phosphotransferase [Rhodococcus sp. BP-323]MBY6434525.1 phosphotransferase [Rhodococcus sp. BP-322]
MTDQTTSSTNNPPRSEHARTIVERALDAYGLAGHDVTLVKYRENHVFRLHRAAGDLAVRLHRASYNTNDAIAAELDLLQALAGAGFDVPAVVPTVDGDLYTTVSDEGIERTVSVLGWVNDAAPMGDIESAFAGTSTMTPEQFHRVGALAGELHNHLSARDASGGTSRPSWDFEGLVGRDAVWGDPLALAELDPVRPLIADALNALSKHLSAVGKTCENYSLIHADFTPENVLVAGDRAVLIDFDDAGHGWHAFEIATLLFWFQPHPRYEQYTAAALAGYASTRGHIDRTLLSGMILARGLTYLGWAAARRGDPTADFIAGSLVDLVARNAAQYLALRPLVPEPADTLAHPSLSCLL